MITLSKFIYIFTITKSLAYIDRINIDMKCDSNRYNCNSDLFCDGPIVDVVDISNNQYLCVTYDTC